MRLTTRGRYAVTAMLDLALHDDHGPNTLADISRRQGISLAYLEQLFSRLRKHGLVDSARGPGGGQKNCQGELRCLTHDLWEDLSQQISNYLDGISLADLVRRQTVRQVSARQDMFVLHMQTQQ